MKNVTTCKLMAMVVCLLLLFPAVTLAGDGIRWMSYEKGLYAASQEDKKLLVMFVTDWCGYCKKMDQETFQNPAVMAYMEENFIAVKVNADNRKDLAKKYRVNGYPTVWFVKENGDSIGGEAGYMPPDYMLQMLRYINSDSYTKMRFETFVKKNR